MRQLVPTLLVEESTLFREGLGQILANSSFKPLRAVAGIDEVPEQVLGKQKSLLCVFGMTDRASLTRTIARLRDEVPGEAFVVVLVSGCDLDEVRFLLRAGVQGILLKSISSETLIKSLELVLLGETLVPSAYLHAACEAPVAATPCAGNSAQTAAMIEIGVEPAEAGDIENVSRRLSCRETAILEQLMNGASNKTIARKLAITEATVKVHVKAILRKIRVRNRTQAAMWAVQNLPVSTSTEAAIEDVSPPTCEESFAMPARMAERLALSAA